MAASGGGGMSLPPFPQGAAVTVGMFDGVHLGHRAVIERLVTRARAAGRPSVLVTFEPHPLAVLGPGDPPERLTTMDERTAALAETDLDYAVVLRFDRTLAAKDPAEFVRDILIDRCHMAELVVGHDHAFGRGRTGNAAALQDLGRTMGFVVDVVDPVRAGPDKVSSSALRRAVREGRLAAAAAGLGRPYRVAGRVEPGSRRGRTIGVPTINVAPPPGKLLPPDGVYAVQVEWGGGVAGGMMNQGSRPTVGDGRRWLEAHLFDFDGDLYGRDVRFEWVAPLRSIRRFESLDALRNQLEHDRAAARAALEDAKTFNRVSADRHTV